MKTENMKARKRYTEDFKNQALELCAVGKSVAEVAQDLCISKDLIRLRREVSELRIDNDILKKAAIILGTKIPNRSSK